MKKTPYTAIFLSLMLLGSCLGDMPGRTGGEDKNGTKLRLTVDVGGMTPSPRLVTRAPVAPVLDEGGISTLHLLFFEPDPLGAGRFVDHVEIQDVNDPLRTEWDVDLVGSAVNVSDAYNILAVANIGGIEGRGYLGGMEVEAWMEQWNNLTESEVAAQATAWAQAGRDIDSGRLLMNGRVEKARKQYEIVIPLRRNQARFDVCNEVSDEYDLVSAALCNAYPVSSIWSGRQLDYSAATARIPGYYSVTNTNTLEQGIDGHGPLLGNIEGGLYAFENRVAMPVRNDRLTTGLIIGLRKRGETAVTYYRANIAPDESAQMIRRNNVYRLTVRNVAGPGAATPAEAFDEADRSDLDYVINYWNLTDSGIILQEGGTILSIPVKTIRIDGKANTVSYQIFTFTSSSGTVSPLAISKETWTPADGGVRAVLTGNTLTIDADPLPAGLTERRGELTISYAGLRAEINVVQSSAAGTFLNVHLPDGGIPRFPHIGGVSSETLRVEASGPWTANIYMPGFSFGADQATAETEIKSTLHSGAAFDYAAPTPVLIVDNRFRIWSFGVNPSDAMREAFVVVSLDEDPENYAAVVRVTQGGSEEISVSPRRALVTFDGMGGLANIPNNSVRDFTVRTSQTGEAPPTYAGWSYETGRYIDTDEKIFEADATLATLFSVVNPSYVCDAAGDGYGFRVEPAGTNLSGAPYNAVLRIKMTGFDSFTDIKLTQLSASVTLSPTILPAVSNDGGASDVITVEADDSMSWSASVATTGKSGARSLVHHDAWLETPGGIRIEPTDVVAMTAGSEFVVRFPKVYYPNRDIPVSATVTVTIAGSTLTRSVTVNQNALVSAGFKGYGITGSPTYGYFEGSYNTAWNRATQVIHGYSKHDSSGNLSTPSIPQAATPITYLHVVPHSDGANGGNYTWKPYYDMVARDGWTVIMSQANSGLNAMNNPASPTVAAGYGNTGYGNPYAAAQQPRMYAPSAGRKVFDFITSEGCYGKITDPASVATFYMDGVNNWFDIAGLPPSAVVITASPSSTAPNAPRDRALMIIDIEHKFFWTGESEQFDAGILTSSGTSTPDAGGRDILLRNIVYLLANAARYGSHFTDLLLDDTHPDAQPAPWRTDWWGANAGVQPISGRP